MEKKDFEGLLPLYTDENKIKISAVEKLWRTKAGSKRYYMDSDGFLYIGVTGFTSKVLPSSPFLVDWKVKQALDGNDWREEMNKAANYGTAMHIAIEYFCVKKKFTPQELKEYLLENYPTWAATASERDWMKMLKDIASWAQFVADRNVFVHAIELPIKSRRLGVASSIDEIISFDFNKGRITALLDTKSGKKGFYPSHRCQLETYKVMYNESIYSQFLPVSGIFNWAPSDWRKTPKYKLENQTDNEFVGMIDNLVELGKAYDIFPNQEEKKLVFNGSFEFGKAPDNFTFESIKK